MKLRKITKNPKVKEILAESDKKWDRDKKSFLLIKINNKTKKLEVGVCNYKDYTIDYTISGNTPEEIYQTIIRLGLISKMTHAAYLGRELEKASVCRKLGLKYIQDEEINFHEKKAQY